MIEHTCTDRYNSSACLVCFADDVQPGDFVQYTLVTDTRVYEVVGKTAKTLRIRPANKGERVASENHDGNPYPVVWTEAESDPDGAVITVRLRKDGTYRLANWARPLRPATIVEGKPVFYTDYRM